MKNDQINSAAIQLSNRSNSPAKMEIRYILEEGLSLDSRINPEAEFIVMKEKVSILHKEIIAIEPYMKTTYTLECLKKMAKKPIAKWLGLFKSWDKLSEEWSIFGKRTFTS